MKEKILYFFRFGVQNIWYNLVTYPIQEKKKSLLDKFLKKQLKLAGIKMSVKDFKIKHKEDTNWFDKYTLTETQENVLYRYLKKLVKQTYPHYSEKTINNQVGMFILNWGFKVEHKNYYHIVVKFNEFIRSLRDKEINLTDHFLLVFNSSEKLESKLTTYINRNYNLNEVEIISKNKINKEQYETLKRFI